MKKHKVRKEKNLYHPIFTPFQKGYIGAENDQFLLCPAGSDYSFAGISPSLWMVHC